MDNKIIKFIVYDLNKRDFMLNYALYIGISIFCNSPLKRGDKGVCKFAATHPRPLFLEGSLKVAAFGSRIYKPAFFVLHALAILFLSFLSIKNLSRAIRTSATKRGN